MMRRQRQRTKSGEQDHINGMDSISVETTIGADNTYSALIRYHAGAQLYSKMGEELDELMEARVRKAVI